MKYGVCIPHYGRPIDTQGLTDMAVKAEQMGFDSVWVTDHIIVPHHIPDRTEIVYRHDMLEPLTLLTHLGAVTKNVSIGTSVIILPYRNPVILAKMIATADVLSQGRVIFGAGVGWMQGEFEAMNAPFTNRGEVSNEYLRLLKELWSNPTPTFEGDTFRVSEVTVSPMPVQRPHPPVWIGGRTRRGIRRAVEFGDYWHTGQTGPKELVKNAAYMRQYSESVGRESPPRISFRATLDFSNTANRDQRPPMQGATEDIIADLQQCAEAGADHAVLEIAGETYDDKFRSMERLISEVKPNVSA